jgi:hypothetical protein
LGLKSGNIALCIQKIKMLKNTGDQMDVLELAQEYASDEPPLRSELFSSDQMKRHSMALAGKEVCV